MNLHYFAFTIGLPRDTIGRVNCENAIIGDIITYKSDERQRYSVVTGTTRKCITVFDLEIEVTDGQTRFYRTTIINPITKCCLKDTRMIKKIVNATFV